MDPSKGSASSPSSEHQPSVEQGPAWAVVGIDRFGTIAWWDDGAVAHLGHARDDVVGRNVELLVPPELRSALRSGLASVARGGPRNVTEPFELPVLRADGTVVTFDARLNHFDAPHGEFTGAVAILVPQRRDATPR